MKTFQEFITEARVKFRGRRTPEEIEALRKKRRSQQAIETKDTPTYAAIRDASDRAAERAFERGDMEQAKSHMSRSFVHTLPTSERTTSTDTRGSYGRGGQALWKRLQRDVNRDTHSSNDQPPVKPSGHPDNPWSTKKAAKRADRIRRERVKKRKKRGMPTREEHREQIRQIGKESRQSDRDSRLQQLRDTVGRIPGQLRDS